MILPGTCQEYTLHKQERRRTRHRSNVCSSNYRNESENILSSSNSPSSLSVLQSIPEDSEPLLCLNDPVRISNSGNSSPIGLLTQDAASLFLTLVNKERTMHGQDELKESCYLNFVAERHAQQMARRDHVSHSVESVQDLQQLLQSTFVGENVQSGSEADRRSLAHMHWEAMYNPQCAVNRHNILAPYFNEFGCATAVSKRGKVYSCQLFRAKNLCPDVSR